MSSWVSHLPPEVKYSKVVGHGMNAAELARNKQLDSFWVRDLNEDPEGWAAADDSFDAVICCVRCAAVLKAIKLAWGWKKYSAILVCVALTQSQLKP